MFPLDCDDACCCDSIGGCFSGPLNICAGQEFPASGDSHAATVLKSLADGNPVASWEPRLVDGHRLEIPGFEIKYAYKLEPQKINGTWYYEYGKTATAEATDYEAFILHHMSDNEFSRALEYIISTDEERGGCFGYHFLIGRDGRIVQAAPLSKRTNHVHPTECRSAQKHLLNKNTLSVSLHGGYRTQGKLSVQIPPTEEQLDAAKIVVTALSEVYGIDIRNAWGHGEVQSDRLITEARVLARWCRGESGS